MLPGPRVAAVPVAVQIAEIQTLLTQRVQLRRLNHGYRLH